MMETEAGLTHYLHVLRRGWWIIALTVVLTTGAAVYASTRQTSLYSSSADVFLSTQNLAAIISNVQVPSGDPVRAAATQADLARNPAVAERALKLAGLSSRTRSVASFESSVTRRSRSRHPDVLRDRSSAPNCRAHSRRTTPLPTRSTAGNSIRRLLRARGEGSKRNSHS